MITRYGPATTALALNARKMSDWSAEDEPIQIETLEDLRDIEIQHGGGALIVERVSEGALLTISLQPGTPDSAWASGLYKSGELVEGQLVTFGTGEKIILSGGVFTKFGNVGRGFKPSYDTYQIKFTKFIAIMGGE
ncbi:hypothetical protein PQE20_27475 (plasmid) [Vibrio harveyi]|uniref:hypothetical protein n=1 Tax=Vibrio harveyi TaxID=669 RepID=UPI00234C99CF|nr:hypothetical protein [Vibrio harveyi]WCP84222.1 hypothetical protein PQE20_27475 [Vibrio harveyi]